MQMRKLALVLLLAGMTSSVAQAEDATAKADTAIDTLQKVKNNGVIVVGHRESSVPFSYYDNQQKVVGYSQDYSNLIV
ncbi:glutamate/aspartate ABC transporter substrate-binding protein, partial [Yersinia pestis]|nr:glutamate/aspartate ABC transporter substrate-binding protein [Yersinia pestis]